VVGTSRLIRRSSVLCRPEAEQRTLPGESQVGGQQRVDAAHRLEIAWRPAAARSRRASGARALQAAPPALAVRSRPVSASMVEHARTSPRAARHR
jgi:hypothetical protein